VRSTLAHLPGGASKIVHDPFHLVKYMNEAVNEVRKSEHRRLQAQGDDTLKSTRQLWLYGMENVPAKHAQRFDEVKELNLQTSRASAIKEVFLSFWLCPGAKQAKRYFGKWYRWAIRSRLAPVKKVARMSASRRFRMVMDCKPETTVASPALSGGTRMPVRPSARARRAIGRTPLTARTAPVSTN
jgi:transposase